MSVSRFFFFVFLQAIFVTVSIGQSFILEGYTYETGNRGYLSQVDIEIVDKESGQILSSTTSDLEGFFSIDLPPVQGVLVKFNKEMFQASEQNIAYKEGKTFLKVEMERAPGYLFEITLADKKLEGDEYVDAITGALIEVYNNTTEKLVLKLENHQDPEFKIAMEKGNHYTILVRKKGYLAKQMEAYVNVRGCILCFEGINDVKPGVTENLTAGNEYGTLLANVEMDKIYSGKSFEVKNLLYDLNSAELKKESKKELDKVINVLRYNPNLTLELGSHTDSRGKNLFNMNLSKDRALSAVKYITDVGNIPKFRIIAAGYGETMLLNDCGDGVVCSEEKHALNRRTEITVVGIDQEWIFKPLVNIKNEIKMELEIYEMIHGKQEELTEAEYKERKALEKSSSLPVSNTKPSDRRDDIVILEVMDENIPEAELNAEKMRIEKIEQKKKADKDKKQAAFDKQAAALKAKEDAKESAIKAKEKAEEKAKEFKENTPSELEDDVPMVEDFKAENTPNKVEEKVVIKVVDFDDMMRDEVVEMPKTENNISDGYKIIIHFTAVPLEKDNPIFNKHETLEIYESSENNFYYMIPGYESTVDAENALKSGLLAVYPSAYIAGFKGGRRIL